MEDSSKKRKWVSPQIEVYITKDFLKQEGYKGMVLISLMMMVVRMVKDSSTARKDSKVFVAKS